MDVVLNSHIAVLVLGYLYEEKLDKVSKFFCKYSPYLDEEYQIIKKGLRPIIINSENLSTIVREHCYIKSKVNEIVSTFPIHINAAFDRQNLSGKINHLLKIVKKTMGANEMENKLKRTRSQISSSSEKESSIDGTQAEDLPAYLPKKKRRLVDSYMFVRNDFSEDTESEDNTLEETETRVNPNIAFADRILEDKKFQARLLQNINKVLKSNSNKKNRGKQSLNQSTQSIEENNLDQMIQRIIAATENDPSFDEVINDILTNNLGEEVPNSVKKIKKNLNKTIQPNTNVQSNELEDYFVDHVKLKTQQNQSSIQLPIGVEATSSNNNVVEDITNNIIKTRSVSEANLRSKNLEVEGNNSNPKVMVMDSNIFPSNLQILSPLKNDQFLLDLNGIQTFPILMGVDGSMYVNSNDVRLTNNLNLESINVLQKNNSNLDVIGNTVTNQTLVDIINVPSKIDNPSQVKERFEVNKNNESVSVESMITKNKTPECNMKISNISFNKSLSTPRRRNSHNIHQNKSLPEKIEHSSSNVNEKNAIVTSNPVIENESSNSTAGEQSNVTVIQNISSPSSTPKRKTSIVRCKNLSHSNSEETKENKSKNKPEMHLENQNSTIDERDKHDQKLKENGNKKYKTRQNKSEKNIETLGEPKGTPIDEHSKIMDPMEEWKQIREKAKDRNFDQFLREMHSKTPRANAHITKRRKLRRKIGSKLKKSMIESQESLEHSLEQPGEASVNDKEIDSNSNAKKPMPEKKIKNFEPKTNFLNFRIKTPIKNSTTETKKNGNKRGKNENSKLNKNKEIYDTEKQPICVENSTDAHDHSEKLHCDNNENDNVLYFKSQTFSFVQEQSTNIEFQTLEQKELYDNQHMNREKEKRTANIAHILDTPFKFDDHKTIPVTPGIFSSSLPINNTITPMTKLMFSSFSTFKNSDIKTPAFAITPGANLGYSTDKETPKSGVVTDYSSGGSYYRPDDSAEINKKLDQELNDRLDQRRPISIETTNVKFQSEEKSELLNKIPLTTKLEQNKLEDSIVAEIIPCPVVLEKVKSFSEEVPDVVPHYKFIEAGLPDITDESTTSSSSSSDDSSSSSSKTSSLQADSNSKNQFDEHEKPPTSLLSNIDSSEDDDWEVQSTAKNKILKENTQLVSNDGEVRFPVRSWITPKKINTIDCAENNAKSSSTLLDIMDETSKISKIELHDNKNEKITDLNEKLERVKAKLSQKSKPTTKLILMKKKITKTFNVKTNKTQKTPASIEKNPKETKSKENQLDVLSALNLSAKHTVREIPKDQKISESKADAKISHTEDNATTELFTLRMEEESLSSDYLEVKNAAMTLTKMKTRRMGELETRLAKENMENKPRITEKNQIQKIKESKNVKKIGKKSILINKIKGRLKEVDPKSKKITTSAKEVIAKKSTRKVNKDKIKKIETQPTEYKNKHLTKENKIMADNQNCQSISKDTELYQKEENNLVIKSKECDSSSLNENVNEININKEDIFEERDCLISPNKNTINEEEQTTQNEILNPGTNNESESESECSYDECELFLAEANSKNEKYIIFDENNMNNKFDPFESTDFSKLAMKITIDDQIHKIDCCDTINLFNFIPNIEKCKSIKSHRKKSKTNKEVIEDRKLDLFEKNQNIDVMDKSKIDESKQPLSSSTPLLRKINITHRSKFNNNFEVPRKKQSPENIKKKNILNTRSDIGTSRKFGTESEKNVSKETQIQESASKKNIRNEDINAVLSHLYGSGK